MNYYERYCGDYQRDTAHLSLAEHGAYTMLLDTYFSVEKPLPTDLASLYRVCRAMTRLEQQAVRAVAEQFFPISKLDGLSNNHRADREIAKARPKIEAARINGRKGGRPSKSSEQKSLQETHNIPSGFSLGCADPTSKGFSSKPDGKAHQHHLQPQHQREGLQTDDGADPVPLSVIFPAEGQGHKADPHFETLLRDCSSTTVHDSQAATVTMRSPDRGQPGASGPCCNALTRHGVHGFNPHHPTFLALLEAGAVEEEFVEAARSALTRGKTSFAYVIGTVKRQREEAAKLVLHRGRLPNRQEMLESRNKAAAEGWLPPELREARMNPAEPKERTANEVPHAD